MTPASYTRLAARFTAFFPDLNRWTHRHPKRWAAGAATLLLSVAGAATAVSALGPDPADLPVREVIDTLAQDLPLPEPAAPLWSLTRQDLTRSSDTAESLLARLGLNDPQAAAFMRQSPLLRQHLWGRAGRAVSAQHQGQHGLQHLTARWVADERSGQFQRLVVQREQGQWTARLESAPLQAQARLSSGTIQTSLFAAADAVGLPDTVASQLAEIFSGDIDFRRALRKGDRFNVVYEVLEADGEPLRTGRVLSAEFVNAGKAYQAMWFRPGDASSRGGYYSLDGKSLRRAFLSSPVAFSRVSSGFAMRFHPILKRWRAHLGTDFAAPTGTPARSVGDGTVSFAGWQNGFGNVVFVKHRNDTETVYAHLSRLLVKRGQPIGQGETVGLVGATGWATGPHLHFEVRVKGQQKDPMAMARSSEAVPVSANALATFRQAAQGVRVALNAAARLDPVAID